MGHFSDLAASLQTFTPQERRNIAIYIAGIMVYKFGLEAFNGSIIALASNRYDYEAIHNGTPSRTFERVGLLTGLNQAFQCIGSILIGPLVWGSGLRPPTGTNTALTA
jgi:cytochrome c biogenesis protein CcdA